MMPFSTGTGLERVGVVGPVLGWYWARLQAMRCRVWGRTAAATDRQAPNVALPCKKNQKEEGPTRVSPVAAPMPKLVSFGEKR